jgi:hypothetical protein
MVLARLRYHNSLHLCYAYLIGSHIEKSVMGEEEREVEKLEDARYTVTIVGPGVRVEQSISKALVPQLMMMLMNAGPAGEGVKLSLPLAALPPRAANAVDAAPRRISLPEYLEEINARRIPERILGMANYISEVTGQSVDGSFNKSDIRPLFKAAGDPLPANFARDWQLVVSAGWVAQESGSDLFFVTRRGKSAIAERFSGEGDRITRIRRRRRVGGGGDIDSASAPDELDEDPK